MFGNKEKKEKKKRGGLFRGLGFIVLLAVVFLLGDLFGRGGGFGLGGNGKGDGDGDGKLSGIIDSAKEVGQELLDKAEELYNDALTSPTPTQKSTETPEPPKATDTPEPTPTPAAAPKTEIMITVDGRSIYLDGEQCSDVNDLKEKINKLQASGNVLPFVKDFGNGINSVVIEVDTMLNEVSAALKMTYR